MKKTFFGVVTLLLLSMLLVGGNVYGAYSPLGLNQAGSLSTTDVPLPYRPATQALIDTFTETVPYNTALAPSMWTPVDPSLIGLSRSVRMTVWQIGEVASMRSQVGYSIGGDYSLPVGKSSILFQDTSTSPQNLPYDFLGTHKVVFTDVGPGKLDFFLIANGAGSGSAPNGDHYLYWTDLAPTGVIDNTAGGYGRAVVNADVLGTNPTTTTGQHSLAFLHSSGNFLIYAWEDLNYLVQDVGFGGVDYDFNDVFFLVQACDAIILIPEPETYLLMGGFLLVAFLVRRRKMQSVAVKD